MFVAFVTNIRYVWVLLIFFNIKSNCIWHPLWLNVIFKISSLKIVPFEMEVIEEKKTFMWKLDKCNFHNSFNFLGCNYIQFQEANHASFTTCDVFPLISDALGSDTSTSSTDTLNKRSMMGHDRGGGGGCSQALFLLLPLLQGSVAAFLLHSEGPFECPGWVEEIKIFWTELLTLFEMIRITKTFQKKINSCLKEWSLCGSWQLSDVLRLRQRATLPRGLSSRHFVWWAATHMQLQGPGQASSLLIHRRV